MIREFVSRTRNKWNYEATQYRNALKLEEMQERKYEAASRSKRTLGWDRSNKSANAEITPVLRDLRGASRDLVKNNPYAKRAIDIISNGVVGGGIKPAFAGKGRGVKEARAMWRKWAGKTKCDFNELLTVYGIQHMVMRAVAESGDALIMRRVVKGGLLPYELQVLESDFLDEGKNVRLPDGGFIMQGVEFSADGKRRGYWIFPEHPGETMRVKSLESRFVPKSEVIHVFEVLRPGQVRGIPMGVSCFVKLKDFDEYQDFQLYKQKVAACFVMVVTDQEQLGPKLGNTDDDYQELDKMGPGIIEYLPSGRDVKFSTPPSVDGYSDYTATVLRSIAVGYGVTYEALTGDYSRVNFSSGRMGWLEFQRYVEQLQDNCMISMFCDPVGEWFLNGLSIVSGINEKQIETSWTTPRREMIDPTKETKALTEQVRNGYISRQEVHRQLGYDPEDVYNEIKEDMSAADAIGAILDSDPRKDAQRIKRNFTEKKPAK